MTDKRFVISEDDLAPEDPPPPTTAQAAAPSAPPAPGESPLWSGGDLPSVEGVRREAHQVVMDFPPVAGPPRASGAGAVGAPRPVGASPGFLRDIRGQSLLAGLVGIAVGWAITEILQMPYGKLGDSQGTLNFYAGIWVGVLGIFFAIVFNGWEEITSQRWNDLAATFSRNALVGGGAGFVSGFVANVIFAELSDSVSSLGDLYFQRAVGWAIFGAGVGAATAAAVQSSKKLQNGIIGGIIGGGLGGLAFLWFGIHIDSESMARLFGLAAVGGGIGLAIGIVEVARRDAWLHIVGGGMAGKEFILYETQTAVGASPKCGVTLIKDPAIQPHHFMIAEDAGGRRQLAPYEGAQVLVNGTAVSQHTLRNGDVIQAGQTSIRYAERAAA